MKKIQRTRLVAISLSFIIGALLMAVKFYAYRITHSSAILSDALESIINVVASAFALGSIILAAKPPDAGHPYGHGKIEFFSAGFEGALIILAAFGIFKTGISHILNPHHLPHLQSGMLILLSASVVNLFLGTGLLRVGRKTDSITLIADGRHVLTDVYTSAGVFLGLLVVYLTGWNLLDGIIACLVGIHILVTGSSLVRHSFRGLMDAADPQALKRVSDLIVENRRDFWIDIHQLRAWKSGDHLHIDLHLVLPKELSLDDAHREAKTLEKMIIDHFGGNASALIHLDPCIDRDCRICRNHRCQLRKQRAEEQSQWALETLTAYKGAGKFSKKNKKESR
ncbi:MAG: cation diffusion facilitator family transporter [Desulfobacterales bacterium]|jgi:cation diffusion facilitator family transporter